MTEPEKIVSEHTRNLKKDIREYIEKRIELFSLTLAEDLSLIIAHSFQRFTGVLIFAGALLFAWFAFAFLLSDLVGNMSAGFALSSVPLFILAAVFMNRKSKSVTEKIQAELIEKMLLHFDKETENNQEKS